jgi:hypothetical protein
VPPLFIFIIISRPPAERVSSQIIHTEAARHLIATSECVFVCVHTNENDVLLLPRKMTHTHCERAHAGDLHMKEQQPICNKINSESSGVISFIESLFCAHMPARARACIHAALFSARRLREERRYQNTI